jgi:xanthine dehydrogenase YagR molybdenum-binding subunit
VYTTPVEHNNPMGVIGTIARWEGDELILIDTSQWVHNVRDHVATAFGMSAANVHVLCPFTGGAFGSTLRTWPHVVGVALAARHVGRPVKLVLTREQMYTSNGYRPETRHRVALGAARDGRLAAIIHDGWNTTSRYEEYTEPQVGASTYLYACDNVSTSYRIVPLDVNTPTWMRAPGENTCIYALESAMDELAYAVGLDPLELRLRNYAERDPATGQEWSSKALRECYRVGAERIGWARRTPEPRSMRDGRWLVGLGVATGTYPANRNPAAARVRLYADGTAYVCSGTQDIGGGTYTAMTQVAADTLGLPPERVRFELGDSTMPLAPPEGGSMIAASVGSAVYEACLAARSRLLELARGDARSPLAAATPDDVAAVDGRLVLRSDPSRGESYSDILRRSGLSEIEVQAESRPEATGYSSHAFGARFAEVRVDPDTAEVRVTRFVNATCAGRILNPKQARSQLIGGTMMGLGMALLEHTVMDARYGRFVNQNYAEYLVPVHADAPAIEAILVDEEDPHVNLLGVKGIGEAAAVGVAPAIANAVYHATGVRVRDLPITPDKLL